MFAGDAEVTHDASWSCHIRRRPDKKDGMLMYGRPDPRTHDDNALVDGLWMTCGRPVKGGGYLTAHLVFSDPLWQLTRTHMSVRGQAVTT